ncbi:class I SAM-dependent methyltransferase [Actinocorallia sp. API 0066]|uniref:class I SAM-dependent methyltransferase n=1 Tax=Actinocorallia sp. API 0066 TaxID=2896846 RepID=UPI001E434317|nr:class I SAM-dependent methyltransferase [Actinocorallia sp. API 0066]MCD0447742.1 class I SAM-dependent methyltransferase [Actinocorallia sp. API 0066]
MTQPALSGDAEMYTRPVLAIYDPIALGIVCPVAWRCSRRVMLNHYDRNVRDRHLDLGPGSGYFLDRCAFPTPRPSIVVADLNELVLSTVAKRIARYSPETLVRDVLHPLDLGDRRFTSLAVQNVLHCLPGSMADKAVVFDHLLPYAEPGARIFGTTVIGDQRDQPPLTRWMMRSYNKAGSFQNLHDRVETLDAELGKRFSAYRVWMKGSMAFFEIDV